MKNNYVRYTVYFIILVIASITIYDIIIISKAGTEASISHVLMEWSYKYPALTFIIGALCGHLFWRIRDTDRTKVISDETRK